MFQVKDDDLLFRHVYSVNDTIVSASVPEQTLEYVLQRRAQASRILNKVSFYSFHNPGRVLLID